MEERLSVAASYAQHTTLPGEMPRGERFLSKVNLFNRAIEICPAMNCEGRCEALVDHPNLCARRNVTPRDPTCDWAKHIPILTRGQFRIGGASF